MRDAEPVYALSTHTVTLGQLGSANLAACAANRACRPSRTRLADHRLGRRRSESCRRCSSARSSDQLGWDSPETSFVCCKPPHSLLRHHSLPTAESRGTVKKIAFTLLHLMHAPPGSIGKESSGIHSAKLPLERPYHFVNGPSAESSTKVGSGSLCKSLHSDPSRRPHPLKKTFYKLLFSLRTSSAACGGGRLRN